MKILLVLGLVGLVAMGYALVQGDLSAAGLLVLPEILIFMFYRREQRSLG
jgi:hypothetical protein